MTCIRIGNNAIACGFHPWGRLKVGNRYVWVDFHPYCGPNFYTDSGMTKLYVPKDESDPVWEPFGRWLAKYQAAEAKKAALKKGPNVEVSGCLRAPMPEDAPRTAAGSPLDRPVGPVAGA